MSDDEKPKGLWAKIAYVQHHVEHVEKSGTVAFGKTNYSYMQEHGLIEVLRPLLREVGLAVVGGAKGYEVLGQTTVVDFELTVADVDDGQSITRGFPNVGVDSGDKAFNKAYTGAMKYALQKFFLVPTEGIDDNDGEPSNGKAQAPAPNVRNRAAERDPLDSPPPIGVARARTLVEQVFKNGLAKKYAGLAELDGLATEEAFVDVVKGYTPKGAEAMQKWIDRESPLADIPLPEFK